MKFCPRCSTTKPATAFRRMRQAKDGLQNWCAVCQNEYRRERRRTGEYCSAEQWRKANPERHKRTADRWYQQHRDQEVARKRAWNDANRERRQEYDRQYYRENPAQFREKARRHRLERPELYREYTATRRARLLGAAGHATAEQQSARIDYYGGKCWMCGGAADTIDHVIPLSRGGSDWPANLRPACRSCNSRKNAKENAWRTMLA